VTVTALAVLASLAAYAGGPDFDCMIEPIQIVEIRSPVVGLIHALHVQRGDVVRKGALLVTIDARVERSSADAARSRAAAVGALHLTEAKLEAATVKAERNQSLYEEGFVSTQARDEAAADRAAAAAEVQAARENLEIARLEYQEAVEQVKRRELRSPIMGVVMDQYLHPGSLVDNSEGKKPIFKLAQTSTLKVESILPFSFYQKLKVGTKATIIPEPPLSGTYAGVVKIIDRVIDSASGTFGVVVELENPSHSIPAGVRCKARFASID
jgi:RND family efflux transporter MFP subunit